MRLLTSDGSERHIGAGRRRRQGLPVLAAMTAVAAVTPGLVAATSQVASASSATKTVTITLGYAGGANIDPYYNHVIAAAEKALPGITVKQVVYSTYDEQLDQMPAQAAAGTIPDIIVWDNSAPVGQYVQNDAIMNLSQLASAANVNLGADPAALVNAWKIGGKLYGIPLYLQDSAYVYNLGLLKEAGITSVPTSMSEVAADALAVHQKTGKAGLTILDNLFHLTQYILAFGGSWNFGKSIDSKANVAGLQFLVNLFNKHAAVLPDQVGASWDGVAVADNDAAMSDGGPWYIGFMSSTAPKVQYELAPIPTSSGKQFVVTYGGSYSITAHSPDPSADMELIKDLTDAAAERYVATDTDFGFVPAMTKYINLYRQMTPRFSRITNAVLDKGLILAYPPNTIQFQIALVSGFENIVLKHSGTVQSLLSSLQQSYGAS